MFTKSNLKPLIDKIDEIEERMAKEFMEIKNAEKFVVDLSLVTDKIELSKMDLSSRLDKIQDSTVTQESLDRIREVQSYVHKQQEKDNKQQEKRDKRDKEMDELIKELLEEDRNSEIDTILNDILNEIKNG
jgi:hypothetical protein